MSEAREKFVKFAQSMKSQFVERDAIIEGVILAAIAEQHVLLLGPPGTAKSALANTFCGSIEGGVWFQWMLSRHTAPEELFGPISLSALKTDVYRRVTSGKLPEAHVAFLDEIFKSGSAILNMLLTAINERRFHNDGVKTIPLRLVVGASNEIPDGTELAALYDRFLLRYWVEYTTTPDNFCSVLLAAESQAAHAITLQDWDVATSEAKKIKVSKEVAQDLYKLKCALAKLSISSSDRRWKRCLALLRANAWMSGDAEVSPDHFSILSDVLWDQPEQRTKVAVEVQKVSESLVSECTKIVTMVLNLMQDIPADDDVSQDAQNKLIALTGEGNRCVAKLKEHSSKARTEGQRNKIDALKDDIEQRMKPLRQRARNTLGL